MNKKLLATVLASTMVLGSMSVYAANTFSGPTVGAEAKLGPLTEAGQKITVKSKAVPLKIDVTLPTTMEMMLNPYEVDKEPQIISPAIKIESGGLSNVGLSVKVTAFELVTAGTTKPIFTTTAVKDDSTKKEIYLYLRSSDNNNVSGDAISTSVISTDVIFSVAQAFATPSDKSRIITKTGTLATPINLGTLKPETKIIWKFDGNMAKQVLWSDKDTVTATPTFTFLPSKID